MAYEDVCSALRLDPDHSEAVEMMHDLQKKALECKNEVKKLTSSVLRYKSKMLSSGCL